MCFWSWAVSALNLCSSFAVSYLLDIVVCCVVSGFQTLRSSASFFEFSSRSKLRFTSVVETFEILITWSSRSSHVFWNLHISVAYNSLHQCIARLFLKKRKKRNKCQNSTFFTHAWKHPCWHLNEEKRCNHLLSTCYDNCHSLPSVWTTQLSSLV